MKKMRIDCMAGGSDAAIPVVGSALRRDKADDQQLQQNMYSVAGLEWIGGVFEMLNRRNADHFMRGGSV